MILFQKVTKAETENGRLVTTVRDNDSYQTSSLEQVNIPCYIDVGGLSVNLSQFGNFLV